MVGDVSESINIGSSFGRRPASNESDDSEGDHESTSVLHETRAARLYGSY